MFEEVSNILSDIYYSTSDLVNKNIWDTVGEEIRYAVLEEVNGFAEDNLPLFWFANTFSSVNSNCTVTFTNGFDIARKEYLQNHTNCKNYKNIK